MALPLLSSILRDVSNKKTPKEKIATLRSHYPNTALKTLLKYAYDDRIKWILPEGIPPYQKIDDAPTNGGLYENVRKLYLFVEGGAPNLQSLRRETLFIELLESIDPKEAELLLAAKDGTINKLYKGVTKNVVSKAFPGLL